MSIVRNLVNVRLGFFRCLLLMVVMIIVTSNIFGKVRVETINGLRYRLNSTTKTATVISFNGRLNKDSLNVPRKVKASDHCLYLVTSLGNSCFSGCTSLTFIIIPSSVTSLGYECFERCTSLADITIPSSVTSLGNHCFWGCSSLPNIIIPSSVTSFGNGCFRHCSSLANITIPSSVLGLSEYCFSGCSSLVSFIVPSSVEFLGCGCFSGCSSLISITVPSDVSIDTSRGVETIFEDCKKLEKVIFKGELSSDSDTNFWGLSKTCNIFVPEEYLQEYKNAFKGYPNIYPSRE